MAILKIDVDEIAPETPISILREHSRLLGQFTQGHVVGEVRLVGEAIEYYLLSPASPEQRHRLFRLSRPEEEPYPLSVLEAPGQLAARVLSGQAILHSHEDLELFLDLVFQQAATHTAIERLKRA